MEKRSRKGKEKYYQAVGRRKRSSATVRLYKKKGLLLVNGKPIEEYFPGKVAETIYREPFEVTKTEGQFSGTVKIIGGGKSGQLGAVVLGVSRALVAYNEDLRSPLRQAGLLTRDPREKEPKKYFLRKARKRPQYSKR
jgi:small subunit ribosomal protein S9